MKSRTRKPITADQKGTVIVLVTVLLFVFLGVTAFAIDFGYRHVVRNELQNAADAAALAGARSLGLIYESMEDPSEQQSYICESTDQARIKEVVKAAAKENRAGAVGELIVDDNGTGIQIGLWDPLTKKFSESAEQPDAVRVVIAMDGSNDNGSITTFFAHTFGIPTLDVSAMATAALTPISTIGEGELQVPVAISQEWFNPDNWAAEEKGFCDQNIKFHPTGDLDGCAGWNLYQEKDKGAASSSDLKRLISQMNPWCDPDHEYYNSDYCFTDFDDFQSPETDSGEEFTFTGGITAALPYFKALYDAHKDSDGNWEVSIPVYESSSCQDNPSGQIPIVGFASAVITGVDPAPSHEIRATVICEMTEPGRGGGSNYGTKGSIPGLVE